MKLLPSLFIVLILSSCAFHNGSLNTSTNDEPVVHKDIAIGVSQTIKIFGIGGVSKDALIFQARQNMINYRPLESEEEFNNVSIDIKNTFLLIGQKTKVTIIADVVEPKDSVSQSSYTDLYLRKSRNGMEHIDTLLTIGDTVIFNVENSGVLLSFDGKNKRKGTVQYYSKNGAIRTKRIKLNNLYVAVPSYNDLLLGNKFATGIIVAFGKKGVIVKDNEGYSMFSYNYDWK
jgi:hypothetical protein